jgi:hypothetical protein
MGVLRHRYRIAVGITGDASVLDAQGNQLWSFHAGSPGTDPEKLCDALLEALSWTVQHHSGPVLVEVPERRMANDLVAASPIDHHSRLASMLDEARVLLTWFESTDVALRDADAPAAA